MRTIKTKEGRVIKGYSEEFFDEGDHIKIKKYTEFAESKKEFSLILTYS